MEGEEIEHEVFLPSRETFKHGGEEENNQNS